MTEKNICIDRILDRDIDKAQPLMAFGEGASRALFQFKKMWINGSVINVYFMDGTDAQHELVKEKASWWTEYANITFNFVEDPAAEIRITFNTNDGAWSYVGTDILNIEDENPTMNLGFLDGGTVAHEFGHSLGLAHEHQNPARGIEWNEAVVIKSLSGPPNRWSESQIRHNVLNKYNESQVRGTEFDPDSIMLYPFPDSWVKNGSGTSYNTVLSEKDISFISGMQAYPGKTNAPKTISPEDEYSTMASIGEPGEEDVFEFKVTYNDDYIIETGGETDVVMKLYGPNSTTKLIAENDDGGSKFNAMIRTPLRAGKYYIQIRHYNTDNGVGDYSIYVDRD